MGDGRHEDSRPMIVSDGHGNPIGVVGDSGDRFDDQTRGAFKGAVGFGCMLTVSGRVFRIHAPEPSMMCLSDLAHHLSLVCRWAGATREYYSVAQHCLHVAQLVPDWLKPAAMLHDAHEGNVGDRIRPFKQIMPPAVREWWTGITTAIDKAACAALGVDYELLSHPLVKAADLVMLAAEGRDLIARFTEEVALPHTNSGDPLPDRSHIRKLKPHPANAMASAFAMFFELYKENAANPGALDIDEPYLTY